VDALGTAAGTEGLFTATYNKLVRREGDPSAATLLLGADSLPIRAEKALYDLAQWCRERGDLAAYLLEVPSGRLAAEWSDGDAPAGIGRDEWREWQRRFGEYLAQYGHSLYDLDFAKPLPADEPLFVRARLEDIDDNGRRALIHQRIVTGTEAMPDCVVAHVYAVVPLGGGKPRSNGSSSGASHGNGAAPTEPKRETVRIPMDAEELQRWRLGPQAGLDFAKLTGDFNPVHWIRPYAKAFGFRSTILHGFATMARTIEGLQRTVFSGSVNALRAIDVKFTKPLLLPAKVGLYVRGDEVWVGDAPGGPAYLTGSFERATGAQQ